MAVQQNKKSRSRRDMRRAHDGLSANNLSQDSVTGEFHLRHHVTPQGFYKGKPVSIKVKDDQDDE